MPKTSKKGKSDAEQEPANASGETLAQPASNAREMSPRTRTISLVIGDILCFLIFVSIGSNQHGEGVNILYSLWLAVPFAAAWFLISPFIGAFKGELAANPKGMALRVLLSWLASWPVAMFFRWLLVDRPKNPPIPLVSFLTFALIALIANLIILMIWRVPFAMNNSMRRKIAPHNH